MQFTYKQSALIDTRTVTSIYPIYRWAGGKGRLLEFYKGYWPDMHDYDNYIEPFFGGGAVWCWMRNRYPHLATSIGDSNLELINLIKYIQENSKDFINVTTDIFDDYLSLATKDQRKIWYYALRDTYLKMEVGTYDPCILYALIQTCYNGVWRICNGGQGRFSTSSGLLDHTRLSQLIDRENILGWSHQLENIHGGHYQDVLIPSTGRSLIYLDPPYRGSYTYGVAFTDEHLKDLVAWSKKQFEAGHSVIFSNRVMNDQLLESLLPEASFYYRDVKYTVGPKENQSKELLGLLINK